MFGLHLQQKKSEKKHGKHPTQKPIEIMERIILASSKENDIILDCFFGSETTLVAGSIHNRNMIGIELEEEYINLSINRLKETEIRQTVLDYYQQRTISNLSILPRI